MNRHFMCLDKQKKSCVVGKPYSEGNRWETSKKLKIVAFIQWENAKKSSNVPPFGVGVVTIIILWKKLTLNNQTKPNKPNQTKPSKNKGVGPIFISKCLVTPDNLVD